MIVLRALYYLHNIHHPQNPNLNNKKMTEIIIKNCVEEENKKIK